MNTINNSLYSQMQNMAVEAIGNKNNVVPSVNQSSNSFGDLLANALESVTDLHKDASKISLAEIMISRSKAGIASEATMQIRNKAIEGYKEIMNMPV